MCSLFKDVKNENVGASTFSSSWPHETLPTTVLTYLALFVGFLLSFPSLAWDGLGTWGTAVQSPMSYGLEVKSSLQEEGLRVSRDLFPTYFFQEVLQPFPHFSAPAKELIGAKIPLAAVTSRSQGTVALTQLLKSLSPPMERTHHKGLPSPPPIDAHGKPYSQVWNKAEPGSDIKERRFQSNTRATQTTLGPTLKTR